MKRLDGAVLFQTESSLLRLGEHTEIILFCRVHVSLRTTAGLGVLFLPHSSGVGLVPKGVTRCNKALGMSSGFRHQPEQLGDSGKKLAMLISLGMQSVRILLRCLVCDVEGQPDEALIATG